MRPSAFHVLLALGITLAGCQPPLPLGRAPGPLGVSLNWAARGLHTQAEASDIDHVVLNLYEVSGVPVLTETTVLNAPLASATVVPFSTTADGTYHVRAEAFASADNSVSITVGGEVTSSNTATIAAGAVSYSAGSALSLPLTLTDGGLATLDISLSGPAGTAYPVQLLKSGIVQTHYAATTADPSFQKVYSGSYTAWGAIRTGAGTSTVARVSSNGATVAGVTASYTSGSELDVTVTGLIRSLSLYDPPVLGPNSMLNTSNDMTADASGNVYIADTTNHRIRKIDTSGNISTVAGNGTAGFLGDGGQATSARLNFPRGIAVDATGNLYIADSSNNRIRKVSVSGIITTVAGTGTAGYSGDNGAATSANMNAPYDVTVDGGSNLFIADTTNNRIRKVSNTGTITTYAGSGTAGFLGDGGAATAARVNLPRGVAIDEFGVLYIADTTNHRVRKVSTGGTISTVAGTGTAGYNADGIMATAANLNFPGAVAIDEFGNLFVADTTNHRVRLVASNGLISTVAGNGTAGYLGDNVLATSTRINAPGGVAVSGSTVFVADSANHRVRKVAATIISTVAGTGTAGYSGDSGAALSLALNIPLGVAGDGAGNIWVADNANHRIRKIALGGIVTTVAGNGTAGISGDGGLAIAAQINAPRGIARDASGNLYVADTANHRIRKITPGGTITTLAGTGVPGYGGDGGNALSAQLNSPYGVAVDALGNVYVADRNNHCLRRIDPAGNISTLAGTGVSGSAGDGGPASAAQLNMPRAVAVDAWGNLYVADTGNHKIRRIASDGTVSTLGGNGTPGYSGDGASATAAQFNGPSGVTVDGAGNVYVADQNNHRVRKIDPSGLVTSVAGTGLAGSTGDGGAATSAKLNNPYGLYVDPTGVLYVGDASNNAIRQLD